MTDYTKQGAGLDSAYWNAVRDLADGGRDPMPGGWQTVATALEDAAKRSADAADVVAKLVDLADKHAPESDAVDHALARIGRAPGFCADQTKLVETKAAALVKALRGEPAERPPAPAPDRASDATQS